MAKRKIININQDKCNGCGKCIPNCPEGALQIIDGKAHLISDLFCDGLGACLGHCPLGAIYIEEREAEKYDEKRVMENIVKHGKNVIKAHLIHLRDHKEFGYLKEAVDFLKEKGIVLEENQSLASEEARDKFSPLIRFASQKSGDHLENKNMEHSHGFSGCPGSMAMDFRKKDQNSEVANNAEIKSELRQWPIQLHLVNPLAPYYKNSDVVLSADCVAYSLGNFHNAYLKGKSIAIACPKLDEGLEVYEEKIKSWIDDAKINTLTVIIMQVPCCGGLLSIAKKAADSAERKIPLKSIVVSLQGEILSEEWV